ncbi:uncharacterized protein LOC107273255 [Cephus cinctus]|uniref:Uncharacterized protein LOC107273255 n=1 Tax=Cephus cinctus TaxID=211228 RepID=A0AAJ7RTP5_CEPCN|nr:uncharacterized protein LOC107273255 [Cephus cinctus]
MNKTCEYYDTCILVLIIISFIILNSHLKKQLILSATFACPVNSSEKCCFQIIHWHANVRYYKMSVKSEKYSCTSVQRHLENATGSFSDVLISDKEINCRRVKSESNVHYSVNYDDLCGTIWPLITLQNPAHTRSYIFAVKPKLCVWEFITPQDLSYLKEKQQNKHDVLELLDRKLQEKEVHDSTSRDIFLKLMFEIFQFSRDNDFTEKSVSALLGIFYNTHKFFLLSPWRTAVETNEFFRESLLLHTVMLPPKSDEIFNLTECHKSLELFWQIYMRNISLIRFTCVPNYRLILSLPLSKDQHEDKDSLAQSTGIV